MRHSRAQAPVRGLRLLIHGDRFANTPILAYRQGIVYSRPACPSWGTPYSVLALAFALESIIGHTSTHRDPIGRNRGWQSPPSMSGKHRVLSLKGQAQAILEHTTLGTPLFGGPPFRQGPPLQDARMASSSETQVSDGGMAWGLNQRGTRQRSEAKERSTLTFLLCVTAACCRTPSVRR